MYNRPIKKNDGGGINIFTHNFENILL